MRPSKAKASPAEVEAEPAGFSSWIKRVITGCTTCWDMPMTHIVTSSGRSVLEPSRRQTSPREFSLTGRSNFSLTRHEDEQPRDEEQPAGNKKTVPIAEDIAEETADGRADGIAARTRLP